MHVVQRGVMVLGTVKGGGVRRDRVSGSASCRVDRGVVFLVLFILLLRVHRLSEPQHALSRHCIAACVQ